MAAVGEGLGGARLAGQLQQSRPHREFWNWGSTSSCPEPSEGILLSCPHVDQSLDERRPREAVSRKGLSCEPSTSSQQHQGGRSLCPAVGIWVANDAVTTPTSGRPFQPISATLATDTFKSLTVSRVQNHVMFSFVKASFVHVFTNCPHIL